MPRKRHHQHGFTLLEALIALIVAALGVLGIAGVQLRTLSDTQNTVRREQAIRLIEDLTERMKVNPSALNNIASYVSDWTASRDTPDASKNCASTACDGAELAAYDLAKWKQTVQRSLPLGDANVFYAQSEGVASNRRQLGVMIQWRENEKAKDDNAYMNAINAAVTGSSAGASCRDGYTCHLQYITVSARCMPYRGDSTTRFFCPEP